MRNVHTRVFPYSIERIRPWIALAWSGTDQDVFPRDHIATWRKNPDGSPGLIPGVTQVGHGPFRFTLRQWDGARWRVELQRGTGWHGFDLEPMGDRTRLTHTLDAELGLVARTLIVPVHDWAIESLFDRLGEALANGCVPHVTARKMGPRARTSRLLLRIARALRPTRRPSVPDVPLLT